MSLGIALTIEFSRHKIFVSCHHLVFLLQKPHTSKIRPGCEAATAKEPNTVFIGDDLKLEK